MVISTFAVSTYHGFKACFKGEVDALEAAAPLEERPSDQRGRKRRAALRAASAWVRCMIASPNESVVRMEPRRDRARHSAHRLACSRHAACITRLAATSRLRCSPAI